MKMSSRSALRLLVRSEGQNGDTVRNPAVAARPFWQHCWACFLL